MPDFTWKSGDTGPAFAYTLTNPDDTPAQLQGATIKFVIRSLTAPQPITLTGTVAVTSYTTGAVTFTPTSADTTQPAGQYMASFQVTFTGGQVQTYPPKGYLWGVIEPDLTSEPQQLVSLPELKDYLNSFGTSVDHSHDAKLLSFIQNATPVIENAVGPVIVRTFEEWHDGGQYWIRLRRRPSTAIGTSPVLNILGCDEYRGPTKYSLSVIADPSKASIYSIMLDDRIGTIYRRTTGGGVIPFGAGPWGGGMPQAVHVVYEAGQAAVPGNVREATLEAIRVNYETTMSTGIGSRTLADEEDRTGPPLGFFLPRRSLELLAPMRRHPAIA